METLKTVVPSHDQECYMWVFLNQLDQELKVAQQKGGSILFFFENFKLPHVACAQGGCKNHL